MVHPTPCWPGKWSAGGGDGSRRSQVWTYAELTAPGITPGHGRDVSAALLHPGPAPDVRSDLSGPRVRLDRLIRRAPGAFRVHHLCGGHVGPSVYAAESPLRSTRAWRPTPKSDDLALTRSAEYAGRCVNRDSRFPRLLPDSAVDTRVRILCQSEIDSYRDSRECQGYLVASQLRCSRQTTGYASGLLRQAVEPGAFPFLGALAMVVSHQFDELWSRQ